MLRSEKTVQRRALFTIDNEEKSAYAKDLNKSGDLHNNYQTTTERPAVVRPLFTLCHTFSCAYVKWRSKDMKSLCP